MSLNLHIELNSLMCPGYDIKLILEFWGAWSTPSLLLLQEPFWPGLAVTIWVISIGRINLLENDLY